MTLLFAHKADAFQTAAGMAPFTTGGTVAYATDQKYSGLGAIKLTQSGTLAVARRDSLLADAGRRILWRWRFDTLPGSGLSVFIAKTASSAADCWRLRLNASGRIELVNNGSTVIAGGTTNAVLSVNTWYQMELDYTVVGANNYSFKLWINGVSDIDHTQASGGTSIVVGSSEANWCLSASNPAATNYWIDSVVIDDGNYASGRLGAYLTTAKLPNANGSSNSFDTPSAGGNRWALVNERPVSATNKITHTATTAADERFGVQNAATGDVSIAAKTQLGYMGWLNCVGIATDELVLDGTSAVCTAGLEGGVIGASGYRLRPKTTSIYPGSDAIGMKRVETGNATDAVINEAGIIIAYTEADTPVTGGVVRIPVLGAG